MERKILSRVIYEKDPPIARIILNYPEKANIQDEEMVWDVDNCLKESEKDWDIKVVVLKANGRGFCAGHNLKGPSPDQPPYPSFVGGFERVWKGAADLFLYPILYLWEFPKPTIAQVHGYVIGGGTYFALLTDITIASEDAYFQMPLVQGLGFPGGETCIEPWVFMNWKRAAEYLYTAKTLSAKEAYEMGLINAVVPIDQLERTVEEMARTIAQAPLSTLMTTKALIKRAWELMGMRLHLQMSHDVHILTTRFDDVQRFNAERVEAGMYARQWAQRRTQKR
jgi:enoyl-CoA hydratase/carnithine racemase